jgi:pimeloyl-ACP methyl ester carboxylesterase
VSTPLSPREVYPAGHLEISQRFISLATGATVRVVERGPRDGIPVVMLPGWGAPLYMYRHALERLPEQEIRAIAVDLRGFGLSDKPESSGAYSLDAYCADLDALLNALDLSRVVLVGQSMGGGLALRYALRAPHRVSGLVLINPTGLVSLAFLGPLRLSPRHLLAAVGKKLVPRFTIGLILRHLAYGNAALITERDVDEYWAPTQLRGFVYAARSALSEFDWTPLTDREAQSLAVPSMVILGAADRLIHNGVRAAERIRGTTVHMLDGGHCIHEEQPDECYRLIGDFARATSPSQQ